MTQTTLSPPPVMAPVAEASTGTSRRTALIAGGLAAAVALAGGGYFLLSGGSDPVPSSAPVVHLPTKVVKPVVKKAPAKAPTKPAAKVPVTSTVPIGRDPFHALYIQPVAAAPAAGPAAPSTSTSTGTPTSSTGTSTTTTPVATAPYSLKLLSISGTGNNGRFFTFSVAGVKKVVISGQKFGKYGELVALTWVTSSTGKNIGSVVQVGDDNPVDLRIGQTISVQ
ncbi:MAG: hypothetical protein M3P04_09760 [Actinomycetota bacterium]|nr:hypothetical protein [Actinomycetota bacterium]